MTDRAASRRSPYLRVIGLPAIVRPGEPDVEFSATQRRILARLGLDAPKPVSLDDLVHAVWDSDPPASARQAIQNQISRVRRAAISVIPDLIATVGDSYALAGVTDAQLMDGGAMDAERALAAGNAQAAFDHADTALELWRGEPFSEIAHVDGVSGFRRASHAACDGAHDLRLEAALHLGMRSWAHAEAERLVASTPLDEYRCALLARALALTGRRGDALAAITETRRRLRTELGIEPGPHLAAAEADILSGVAVPGLSAGTSGAGSASGGRAGGSPGTGRGGSGSGAAGFGGAGSGVAVGSDQQPLAVAARLPAPPLVGRDADLRAVLRAVAHRKPAHVRGEHGSGVSRLLFETRTRLIGLGVQVVLVRAEQHPASAMSLIEEILAELGVAVTRSHSALSTFTSAVHAVSEEEPLAIIVDDVHLLGPTTWEAIASTVAAPYVGVVLGGHGEVMPFADEVEIPLGPLDAAAVRTIAQARGVRLPGEIDWLIAHSGGNPLAVTVLAGIVAAPDSATDSVAGVIGPLSGSDPAVDSLVARLTEHLDLDGRRDLELAAVAGDGYPVRAYEHLTWPHVPGRPANLVLLAADGTQRFQHGAVRAHLYQRVPRGVASDWHHALGLAAGAAGAPAATVARHLLAAAEVDPVAAVAAARSAARAAGALGAHADAAQWFQRALAVDAGGDAAAPAPGETAQRLAQRIALRIEHADALRLAGDPAHMAALLSVTQDALALRDDQLLAAAGFALLQLGGSSPAGDVNRQVAELAGRVIESIADPQLRAPVQAAASLAWSMTGNVDTSRRLFRDAEAAAVTTEARLRVLPFAYLAVGHPAELARRESLTAELAALADAGSDEPGTDETVGGEPGTDEALSGEPGRFEPIFAWEAAHLDFSNHLQRGRGPEMREALRRMEKLIPHVGDVGRRWSVLYCSATVAHIDGDLDLAESLAAQAHAMFAPVSPARAAAAYYSQLLPLRLDQGRLAELRPVVTAIVAEQPGVTAWHAAAALVLADALADVRAAADPPPDAPTGTPISTTESEPNSTEYDVIRGDAIRHLMAAADLAQDDFTWLAAHVIGGRAAAMIGEKRVAARYFELLKPWAGLVCWQGTCSYGPVADVLALLAAALGDEASAREYAVRAAELRAALAG